MINLKKQKSKVHKLLRKSHRSVGVFLSVFILLLSSTGILLNHTTAFGLDQSFVPAFIAARYYPGGRQKIEGFFLAGAYYYVVDDRLYVDRTEISHCSNLKSIVALKIPPTSSSPFLNQIAILCENDLLFLTEARLLIERLDASSGLPNDIKKLEAVNGRLILYTETSRFSFNSNSLQLDELADNELNLLVTAVGHERVAVPRALLLSESVSLQQFILDVHSGMFLGNIGKFFADIIAICLSGMAISGLAIWFRSRS